jgi:hypothetical protein
VPSDDEGLGRQDVEALLEVRRELGPSYDAALVDSFAERIETVVAERTESALSRRRAAETATARGGPRQLALGIVSMVAAIPISIVLGVTENFAALLVAWVGIVAVNMAHALQARTPASRH